MFPKKGKGFPGPGGTRAELDYAASIATALRGELGDSHQAIKTVMRWTGATDRTAKNWVTGIRGPTGEHLIIIGTTLGCGFRSYNPSGGSRIAADSIAVNQRTREARGSTGDPRSARGRRADSTRTTEIVAWVITR